MEQYDVIVIGGGAAGLTAAITAARRKKRVLVLEHKERLGKKILATGNGKCNYTNLYQNDSCYRGSHPEFSAEARKQFDEKRTIAFFEEIGIEPKNKNGYIYPNSEQAVSLADALSMECVHQKVTVRTGCHVDSVKKEGNRFAVKAENQTFHSTAVVLSAGGCAAPKQGSDGSGYAIAKALGHTLVEPFPALVQLKTKETYGKKIAGVRCEGTAVLHCQNKLITTETGEFLFTDYGLSGIPIMQMSRYAISLLRQKQSPIMIIDLLPQFSDELLTKKLKQRFHMDENRSAQQAMTGLINQKLADLLLYQCDISLTGKAVNVDEKKLRTLSNKIKQFSFTITGSNGFEQAQVCAGGINTNEVNSKTMESKRIKNLFFAGEILDIDGTCGGYNLQWAWSSGFLAGSHV